MREEKHVDVIPRPAEFPSCHRITVMDNCQSLSCRYPAPDPITTTTSITISDADAASSSMVAPRSPAARPTTHRRRCHNRGEFSHIKWKRLPFFGEPSGRVGVRAGESRRETFIRALLGIIPSCMYQILSLPQSLFFYYAYFHLDFGTSKNIYCHFLH